MKKTTFFSAARFSACLVMLLLAVGAGAQTKAMPDACTLLTDAQINKLFNTGVQQVNSVMKGVYCQHTSSDKKVKVTLQYTDFKSKSTVSSMLKMGYTENAKNIQQGKKAVGVYTVIKTFPAAGADAYYMTGPGDAYAGKNLVRLQFELGGCQFTLDVEGLEIAEVLTALEPAYKQVKANAGM